MSTFLGVATFRITGPVNPLRSPRLVVVSARLTSHASVFVDFDPEMSGTAFLAMLTGYFDASGELGCRRRLYVQRVRVACFSGNGEPC